MTDWTDLPPSIKRQMWYDKDPRVPPDWLPPNITPWHKLTHKKKNALFREGDPRVPPDYRPIHRRSDWDVISEKRKKALWQMGDPRVPPDWSPPLSSHRTGFRTMQNPEAVVVELTPYLLAISENELWDYLEKQWDEILLSPNWVTFRAKDLNLVTVRNPRYKTGIKQQ